MPAFVEVLSVSNELVQQSRHKWNLITMVLTRLVSSAPHSRNSKKSIKTHTVVCCAIEENFARANYVKSYSKLQIYRGTKIQTVDVCLSS